MHAYVELKICAWQSWGRREDLERFSAATVRNDVCHYFKIDGLGYTWAYSE